MSSPFTSDGDTSYGGATVTIPALAARAPGPSIVDDPDRERRQHTLAWIGGIAGHQAFGWPQPQSWLEAEGSIVWPVRMHQVQLDAIAPADLAMTGRDSSCGLRG